MIDALATLWQPILVASLLIGVVWYKQSLTQREAYRAGATAGFTLGVDRTITAMVEQNMVNRESKDGGPITKDELIEIVGPIILTNVVNEVKRMVDNGSK